MKKPVVIEGDRLDRAPHTPADAPPVPEDGPAPEGRAMVTLARIAGRRRPSAFFRVVRWALLALIGMVVSLAAWDFVTGLMARNAILGQVALGLIAIVGLGIVVAILREISAYARLARIDAVQDRARKASADGDRAAALAVSTELGTMLGRREELRLGAEALARRRDEVLDADALLALTERSLMAPLDVAARTEIEAAARQVAAVTALVPLALADVAAALFANVRMIRRIAEIYGGRAGTFGAWRLLRSVATHLIATGAVAVGDDMIGSVAGGGMLSKLSRRFGEGVVNGALTARVGIAAMEVCRPLPFHALPRPRVSNVMARAMTGLFGSREDGPAPPAGQ